VDSKIHIKMGEALSVCVSDAEEQPQIITEKKALEKVII
jgi:hypothetical protein